MAGRTTVRCLVRLTPVVGRKVDDLLKISLSLDVWEREADAVVAAASEQTIAELERRQIAGETPGRTANGGRNHDLQRVADDVGFQEAAKLTSSNMRRAADWHP